MTMTNRMRALQLVLIALVVMGLDQASKYWLVMVLDMPARSPLRLCDYFALVMAWNTGVSFSMFAHGAQWMPTVLTVVALGISAMLARLAMKTEHRLERIGYAMVVGGALGNAIDRIRFGAVADFFYAHIDHWGFPAFNVADSAICCGVALLLFSMMKHPARP